MRWEKGGEDEGGRREGEGRRGGVRREEEGEPLLNLIGFGVDHKG